MLASRSSSLASRAIFSSASSVGRWLASASTARSSAASISAGSAPLLPRMVALRNWISAISAGSCAFAAARSSTSPASSQRSFRSCTRASDSSAATLSGVDLQHLLQRLGGALRRVEVLLPDVGDRHPQGQLRRPAPGGRLDVGVLAEHVDEVVPALGGAQDAFELEVAEAVARIGVEQLAQEPDRLVDVRELLLGVARQLEQHRHLIGAAGAAETAQQDLLQRRPVAAPILDRLQRRERQRVVGRDVERLAVGLRRPVRDR